MWPFQPYPESSAKDVAGQTYDYIVIGGGTGGCALAFQLSQDPNVSVLVIEKGRVKDTMLSRIPLVSQSFEMAKALQIESSRWSEPIPSTNGRKNRVWGVEGIGGGSRINAMLWTRGTPADFAAWEDMGYAEWGWDKVEPYFQKIENAVSYPESSYRGHEGPMEIRAEKSKFGWAPYLERAAERVGVPIELEDCNSPNAPAVGYFTLDQTINGRGERISAFRGLLNKDVALRRRRHLAICTGTIVSKLEIDATNGIVTGAHLRPSTVPTGYTASNDFFVRARREVIVCSGAIATPQLLMLSGIGPKAALEKHGIPILKDLPAVGARLEDHYSFPLEIELPRHETLHILQSIWALWYLLLWVLFGAGLMARGSTPNSLFARTGAIDPETMQIKRRDSNGNDNLDASQTRNIPDIEIMIIPVHTFQKHTLRHSLFSFYPTLTQPYGKGCVELASVDPLVHPKVTLPMLRDERDAATARTAVRFTMRIIEEFQRSGYPHPAPLIYGPGTNLDLLTELEQSIDPIDNTLPPPLVAALAPQDHENQKKLPTVTEAEIKPIEARTWRTVTDEEIDEYVSRVSHTSLHYCSTCPMSKDESSGVVNEHLKVHGFSNLRIADASVFPRLPSAHPMAPILMVAYRCADFIKEEWEERKNI